jgi:hypothetical protein
MARWSFMLIAVIAVASYFDEPVVGQFQLTKITASKLPPNNVQAATTSADQDTAGLTSKPTPTPSPAGLETVKEYLLTSAANDFQEHQPPFPAKFRQVRIGHLGDATKSGSYRLCGEFLPADGGSNAKWPPFATIKTSGYEQYLGTTNYCTDKKITWDTKGDLASELKNKLDSLKKDK